MNPTKPPAPKSQAVSHQRPGQAREVKGQVLTGAEFLALCRQVEAEGNFISSFQVTGARYRVLGIASKPLAHPRQMGLTGILNL